MISQNTLSKKQQQKKPDWSWLLLICTICSTIHRLFIVLKNATKSSFCLELSRKPASLIQTGQHISSTSASDATLKVPPSNNHLKWRINRSSFLHRYEWRLLYQLWADFPKLLYTVTYTARFSSNTAPTVYLAPGFPWQPLTNPTPHWPGNPVS